MNYFKEFYKIFFRSPALIKVTPKNLVFITGCDSGLGFNLALHCHSLRMTVIAGCLSLNSDGIKILKELHDSDRIIPIELNLLKDDTIKKSHQFIENMCNNDEFKFSGFVNNAGVMIFGELEWQTEEIVQQQIEVNLLGPMKLTKTFLPLIRRHKTRIINVTSHCGLHSLSGLAPYSASKSGLKHFNDALRIELHKYGVHVVNFIPGSFVMSSNIAARQEEYSKEMKSRMTKEQLNFYGDYYDCYMAYLKMISGYKNPTNMRDKLLMQKFEEALLADEPKPVYIHEPWRYTLYYNLFKIMPTRISDLLTEKFLTMPKYQKAIE